VTKLWFVSLSGKRHSNPLRSPRSLARSMYKLRGLECLLGHGDVAGWWWFLGFLENRILQEVVLSGCLSTGAPSKQEVSDWVSSRGFFMESVCGSWCIHRGSEVIV